MAKPIDRDSSSVAKSSEALVRLATVHDIKKIYEHHQRHWDESGADGDVIFMPQVDREGFSLDRFYDEKYEAFEKSSKSVGWQRMWIVTDETHVFGMLKLNHHPKLECSLHRCLMQMGIERTHRRDGHGSELLSQAIAWAKSEGLTWMQLNVFENNGPAKSLYRKFGFKAYGTIPDLFRINGESIDDTEMLLRLNP